MTETPSENVYYVFRRQASGAPLTEVGSVDAKNPKLAKMYARENYARRKKTTNLVVVREDQMHEIGEGAAYGGVLEKEYREDSGYDVEGFPA
jgi:ring-1,2-phenylacetyl-CoA epoxidase subunit PaaB